MGSGLGSGVVGVPMGNFGLRKQREREVKEGRGRI